MNDENVPLDVNAQGVRELLRENGKKLTPQAVALLLKAFYKTQMARCTLNWKLAKIRERDVLSDHLVEQLKRFEKQIELAMRAYTGASELGKLVREVVGIGPILAAGLLAYVDIRKAPYAGNIWSYAGLNPERQWETGQRRPWNPEFRQLCFKIGDSFVKCAHLEGCEYGELFLKYKREEWKRNLNGEFAAEAVKCAERVGEKTEVRRWGEGRLNPELINLDEFLESPMHTRNAILAAATDPQRGVPMLSPAHIHARARRWVVKLFLSHYHYAAYKLYWKAEPARPYVLEHCNGQTMMYWPEWLRPIVPVEIFC